MQNLIRPRSSTGIIWFLLDAKACRIGRDPCLSSMHSILCRNTCNTPPYPRWSCTAGSTAGYFCCSRRSLVPRKEPGDLVQNLIRQRRHHLTSPLSPSLRISSWRWRQWQLPAWKINSHCLCWSLCWALVLAICTCTYGTSLNWWSASLVVQQPNKGYLSTTNCRNWQLLKATY